MLLTSTRARADAAPDRFSDYDVILVAGDITPSTPLGQVLAAMLMIVGYSVIAVPTGIVSAEVATGRQREVACHGCGSAVHGPAARFCDACGTPLPGRS